MEGTVKLNSKSVAWYWVIEYFSTLKQIDASILRELIELVPEIHDEEFGAKTREAVALRCLEELFDPLPDPATVDAQANGHFDFSRSCEEVLAYIRRRASISELKSGAPESLKSRVIPFIIHKRATMGQTALSKLKDELVRGTHPFAASLSKGSGLLLANVHDKDDVLALPRRSPTEANVEAQVSEVQERLVDTNLDNVDAQVHEVQESLIATTLDNVKGNADAQVPQVQESLIATTLDNVEGNADAQVSVVQESLIATTHDNMDDDADVQVSEVQEIHNGDAQVFAVQESLIATTGDNVVGNADAKVAKPQGAENADSQVFVVRESLIATIHDNVDDNDDVQVSKAQEILDAVVDDSIVLENLIATIRDNVDGNADVQVSKAQEIHNADAPVSVVQESLIATTHDNLDRNADTQVSKAQESLCYTSFDDANGNADAQVAEAQVSLIATTIENVDGDADADADAQVSKAQEKLICTTLDDANGKSDAQVTEVQESLIATILNNVDGTAGPQVSKAQERLIDTTHDDANGNADSQAVEAQVSSIPTILENMDGAQRHDMHAEEFFPLKRKSNDSPDKYVDGQAHEIENQDDQDVQYDHYLVSKKFRLDPSCGNQSVVQTLVPLHDNADEFVQENSSQIVAEASKEVRKYSKLGGLEESPSLGNGHDERLGLVSDINGNSNFQPNRLETAYNTDKVSRGASGNGSHDYLSVGVVSYADLRASSVAPALKTQNVDGGKIDTDSNLHENVPADTMEHLSKEDIEFDNDGYDNERLKVSEIEGNIFNSPCKVNHGSSQLSESPVLNLCVKCNKEGSLLVCTSINCSLGFHESCFGSPVKFDDEGYFYCPFCAYSRALSEYRKCMESFSSAKKELYSFFNTNEIHRPKEVAKKLYRTKHHHPR